MKEYKLSKKKNQILTNSIIPSGLIGFGHGLWSATDKLNSIAVGETPDIPKAIRDANLIEMRPEIIRTGVIEGVVIAVCVYLIVVGIRLLINRKKLDS